jgi:hypothetical protein
MSRKENAGHRNIKIDKTLFKNVERFKYSGTTVTNKIWIHEEIKNILNMGLPATIRSRAFCVSIRCLRT